MIGTHAARHDVPPKIDGTYMFSNDETMPGMLYGATVRSTEPHARLITVDTRSASQIAGVICVLTIDDVPGNHYIGHITPDQPVLADGVVRYVGEPIAFVVATTQELAWGAAAAVHVGYETLPVVHDPKEALDGGAPLVHGGGIW